MGLALGIHLGHHASCAVVKDGVLCGAVQLERISRKKHHAVESLWDALPVAEVLDSVKANMSDVDIIVSCFQGGCPAGFGLHHPLVEPSFSLFDPFEPRHQTMSHHLAHAYCASAYAPKEKLAILISDYAGSSTLRGDDYDCKFSDWYQEQIKFDTAVETKTECLSIYEFENDLFTLKDREFHLPHPMSETAICSVSTLFENVSFSVFRERNAHGSLMALAALGNSDQLNPATGTVGFDSIIDISNDHSVVFKNNWQHEIYSNCERDEASGSYWLTTQQSSHLAMLCQSATEEAIVAYAKRSSRLCDAQHIALAGGTFLNILANSRVADTGLFRTVSLPSAPHDAGISIGCAFRGAKAINDKLIRVIKDRIGPIYSQSQWQDAVRLKNEYVVASATTSAQIALLLDDGAILARCSGRSEFGPRALGGRSLIASPKYASSKERLNVIKKRQAWRPVAPIVASGHLSPALRGVEDTPWMTFAHSIHQAHQEQLPALYHPDNTTRAQSLERHQDPWLYELLEEYAKLSGYHILCNTSLNGPGEPIIETPAQAVKWFLENPGVDYLLLNDELISRKNPDDVVAGRSVRINSSTQVLTGLSGENKSVKLILANDIVEITSSLLIDKFASTSFGIYHMKFDQIRDSDVTSELLNLLIRGFFVWDDE